MRQLPAWFEDYTRLLAQGVENDVAAAISKEGIVSMSVSGLTGATTITQRLYSYD